MKKTLAIMLFVLCALGHAQKKNAGKAKKPILPGKTIELYDLLIALTPEKSNANWAYLNSAPLNVSWKKPNLEKDNGAMVQTGIVMLTVDGKKFVHNDNYSKAIIRVLGDDKKIKGFSLEVTTDMYADILENLKGYFKAKKITEITIKEKFQGFYNEGIYEFKNAGNASLWVRITEMTNKDEMNASFYMETYFQKKDLDAAIKASK